MGALTVARTEQQLTPYLDWSVAELALRGQKQSGDLHVVRALPEGVLVSVIDGLGHGDEAAHAASIAAATMAQYQTQSVIDLVRRCHTALIGTRGSLELPVLRQWGAQIPGDIGWDRPIAAADIRVPWHDPYIAQLEHFQRMIRADEPALVSVRDGARTLAATLAVARSAADGKPVAPARF